MNGRTTALRTAVLLGSAIVVLALSGCAAATEGGTPGTGGHSVAAHTITGNWQLVSGSDAQGDLSPGAAVVTFRLDGNASGGHGTCNSYGAKTNGTTTGAITIVVGLHTEMACVDEQLNDTEGRYFRALDSVTTATMSHGQLRLTGSGDELVFRRAST